MAAKFAYVNLLQTAGVVITPSSELASMPRGNLLRQGSSIRWRSKTGWTFLAGENDKIDFNRGGVKAATITGTYATPSAVNAAVVAAMTAADGATTWTCTYTSNKFTIGGSAAFTLLFNTGTNFFHSAHPDLGYTDTDKGSAVSQVAENVSYQGRHSVSVDLGSALNQTIYIVTGHNVTAAGTMLIDFGASPYVGTPFISTLGSVLVGTATRVYSTAPGAYRYVRLTITDVQNPAGYVEVGVFWPGLYSTVTVLPAVQYSKDIEHLSEVSYADGGAHHQVLRTRRRIYKLLFQLEQRAGLAVADRALFDAIDALGIFTNLFMILDLPGGDVATVYGHNRVGLNEMYDRGTLWAISMEFAETLG